MNAFDTLFGRFDVQPVRAGSMRRTVMGSDCSRFGHDDVGGGQYALFEGFEDFVNRVVSGTARTAETGEGVLVVGAQPGAYHSEVLFADDRVAHLTFMRIVSCGCRDRE